MADVMEARTSAATIRNALAHTSWQGVFEGPPVPWFGVLMTRCALCIEGEAPLYTTGRLSGRDGEGPAGSIYVYTATRVIVAGAKGDDWDAPELSVKVLPRAALSALSLSAEASLYEDDLRKPWPGNVSVAARYSDGSELTLPAERPTRSEAREPFAAFLPGLLSDLG